MSEIAYSATKDSLTVVLPDGENVVVGKGAENYAELKQALYEERWDDVPHLLTLGKVVEHWARGDFTVVNGVISYKGDPIPDTIAKRILAMVSKKESPEPLLRFWERLERNPSWRSVQQLFNFLAHAGIPLEPDGTFLAYKSVRSDYLDHHSGKVSNKPGQTPAVARNKVSDDPETACHYGLHVGALEYAKSFGCGGRIVIIRVDPEHVVCVPKDSSFQKMRVCTYEVIGDWNGIPLPDTTFVTDDYEVRPAPARTPSNLQSESSRDEEWDDEEWDDEEWDDEEWDDDDEDDGVGNDDDEDDGVGNDEDDEVDMPKRLAKKPALASKPVSTSPTIPGSENWTTWDSFKAEQLSEIDLGSLRQYATHHIRVVGASKIPGGKPALIRNILEIRDNGGFKN